MKPRLNLLCTSLFVSLISGAAAFAADRYWDGNDITANADGGAGSWTTGGTNWDDAAMSGANSAWADNDFAIFGGVGGAVALGGPITANGLTFNSTGYTVSGNTLTLGASPVTVTSAGHSANISSIISGTVGLNKLGLGTLVLAADHTYTGGTTVSAGTLSFSNANQLEGATSVATGAFLEFNPTGSTNTLANAFSGAGTIKVNMSGAAAGGLTMSSMNSFTGTLELSAAATTGDKLRLEGQVTTANLIVGNGTSLYKLGSNATIGSLSIVGTGNSENRGAIRLEAGTLTVTNGVTLQGNTTFGISGGGLAGTIKGTATTGNTQILTLGTSNTNGGATFSGIISDGTNGGKLALNIGAVNMGDIAISGVNTYTGGTTINFGRVSIGAVSSALGSGTVTIVGDGTVGDGQLYAGAATLANNFIISGAGGNLGDTAQRGALRLDGSTVNGTVTLAANASIGVNSGTGTVNGLISGGFRLSKVDGGTLSLNNASNSYSGGTRVAGGTLSFSSGALSSTGTITMEGGTLQWNAGNTQDVSSRINLTGAFNATFNTNGNDVTFGSALSGTTTGSLFKAGAGKLTLTGFLNLTGTTGSAGVAINGGVLSVSTIADSGTTSQIGNTTGTGDPYLALNNGTLLYTGTANVTTARKLWIDTGAGTIDVANAAASLTFTSTGGNQTRLVTKAGEGTLTLDDSINSATGAVTVNAGTFNLRGVNTYTGTTILNVGTLAMTGTAGASTGASATTIGGGGTLLLDNSSASVADRFGAGAITMNGGNISYFHNGAAGTNYAETLGALNIGSGLNTILTSQAAAGQTSKLTFASLSRTSGSVNFVGTGLGATIDPRNEISFTTAPALTGGIIGSWATVNGTDLATLSGNSIVTYTGYTDIDARGPSTIPDLAGANIRILGDGTSGTIDLGTTTTTITSLMMSNASFAATVDTASKTLITDGVIVAVGAQGLTLGVAANDGSLQVNSAGGTLTLNNQSVTNGLTVNSVIGNNTSASGLLKAGAGLVTLAGTNTYTGVTTIEGGTLAVSTMVNGGGNGGLGASTNAQANLVLNGGALRYTGSTATSDRGFTIGAGKTGEIAVSTAGQTLTLTGGIANTNGSLLKTGAGDLTLGTTALSHSGMTSVTGGKLTIAAVAQNSSGFYAGPGATLEFGATNIFVAGHGVAIAPTRVITVDGGTLIFNTAADFRFGNVTLNNGATWTSNRGLAAYDALLANTTSGAATVSVTGNAASTMNGSGGIHLQGVQNFDVTDVTSSAATDLTVSLILGAQGLSGGAVGGINKMGAGTMSLTGANTYTGATLVNQGRLISGNTSATASSVIASGAVLEINNPTGTRSYSVATSFSGAGKLEKTGLGNVQFTGAATFQMASGSLIDVREGTFTAANGANEKWRTGTVGSYVYNLSDLNVESGAIFDGVEASATADGGIFVDAVTGAGTIKVGYAAGYSNTLTYGADNGSGAFSGSMQGNTFGAYVKAGSGTQTLTGVSTYAGTTTVSAGTLKIGGAGSLGSGNYAGAVSVATGATFEYASSGDQTLSGAMTGDGLISKTTNTSTLTLSGISTAYTGDVTVSSGKLLVTGSLGDSTSTVTVNSGAALGGTGTIGGGITLVSGADFWVAGTGLSALTANGTITFGSGFGIDNLLNVNWDSLALDTPITIINSSQDFSGLVDNFGAANAVGVGGSGRSAYFVNGSLALMVVPEPTTALLGTFTLLAFGLRRRRVAEI